MSRGGQLADRTLVVLYPDISQTGSCEAVKTLGLGEKAVVVSEFLRLNFENVGDRQGHDIERWRPSVH